MSKWLWVLYPLGVLVFILYSVNFLFGGENRVDQFMQKQQNTENEQIKISAIKEKLAILGSTDVKQAEEDLATMLAAVPASKRAWLLITQARMAGVEAGASLISYSGQSGEVKEASESAQPDEQLLTLAVEYDVSDFYQLATLSGRLELYKPMIKVVGVEYDGESAVVRLNGAFAGWMKVAADPEAPLPRVDQVVSRAKILTAELIELPEAAESATEGAEGINPF